MWIIPIYLEKILDLISRNLYNKFSNFLRHMIHIVKIAFLNKCILDCYLFVVLVIVTHYLQILWRDSKNKQKRKHLLTPWSTKDLRKPLFHEYVLGRALFRSHTQILYLLLKLFLRRESVFKCRILIFYYYCKEENSSIYWLLY